LICLSLVTAGQFFFALLGCTGAPSRRFTT